MQSEQQMRSLETEAVAEKGLLTRNPAALAYLFTETLFAVPDADHHEVQSEEVRDVTPSPRPTPTPIATKSPSTSPPPSRKFEFKVLGNLDERILFLVNDAQHEWMSDQAMDAFRKSLAALGKSEQHIGLVNLAHSGVQPTNSTPQPHIVASNSTLLPTLLQEFKPHKLVLLGVNASLFNVQDLAVDLHRQIRHAALDECILLATYHFDEMLNDIEKKKAYWQAVKPFLS